MHRLGLVKVISAHQNRAPLRLPHIHTSLSTSAKLKTVAPSATPAPPISYPHRLPLLHSASTSPASSVVPHTHPCPPLPCSLATPAPPISYPPSLASISLSIYLTSVVSSASYTSTCLYLARPRPHQLRRGCFKCIPMRTDPTLSRSFQHGRKEPR